MLSGVALVVILSVDVGWTVNYSFFTAAGIDRKAPAEGLKISWMGRGGQVAAFEGKFLCFAHSLAFMATFPIGALPQLLKGGKKLLSVQKYPNRSLIFGISG